MVLYISKWDILPGKTEDYTEWTATAMKRLFSVPGIKEFRAYRPVTGSHQAVVTYEFVDFTSWASWMENETVQKVNQELRDYAMNVKNDLLGPSPVVPEPIKFDN
ncbi:MAG: hypothetical protein GY760_03090 [Deltaproteobacteria bacterium]|nr:hypothetical protein [Deltaproteobacteria bacterium]